MEIRVFVVEDSASGRAHLDETLNSLESFRVCATAVSEPQATEWLKEHKGEWDLAIVDLVLERGSGFGVVRAARQSSADARIVVFSAYATPELGQRCIDIGADAVFDKGESAQLRAWLLNLQQDFDFRR